MARTRKAAPPLELVSDPIPASPHSHPDPVERAIESVRGTVVVIAGQEWMLADFVPALGSVWDRLVDQAALTGYFDLDDVLSASIRLLIANYELSASEVISLVRTAAVADLKKAVEIAIQGGDPSYKGWSEWVAVSLLSNNIRPADVPPSMLQKVLNFLVATGRTIPVDRYVSSLEAAKALGRI